MLQKPSENEAVIAYFSDNYRDGRARFLDACAARGLGVHASVHPRLKGPAGEALAMDHVWIGDEKAERVLFITCGTHGLEAAAGAATMLQFLESEYCDNLPPNIAILLVHGVNPYGWAFDRRGNEDGLDLNRNCLDHQHPYPQNPVYDELHPLIKSAHVDEPGLAAFAQAFQDFSRRHGLAETINGVTAGQYNHPDGMSFGGHTLSWSWQTLFAIANQHLRTARKIVHIDWHTGIGDFGEPFFITDAPKGSPDYERAAQWWAPNPIHADDILEGSAPNYTGMLVSGMRDHLARINKAETLSVVIEWGTHDLFTMLQALLLDDWLKQHGAQDTRFVKNTRQRLIDLFYPQDLRWRESVLAKAPALYVQALEGLDSW